ncbi:hypothetical protein P170DRAFT_507242 [Aspergillus steynii IBT 23096]|uniref:Myb-like domain-containing protein n=1 Tax=Aspergillus steynii IBT 23096 TaxID=1392250 RepID=A0A2I2GHU8_9EURO|nr:uncharacterized protein P170DRAFT_507242 [Aspergillus steynii IBT 23096]PLB52448.1 hypothetical protein P170DRAFT_507242 [Aspergillus steynii IBT 23096]
MARSRSRSASRPYEPTLKSTKAVSNAKAAVASPSRRRVTRSQSREPELSGLQNGDLNAGRPSTNARSWKQNMGRNGKGLDAVVEESPVRSPAKSPRKSGARHDNHTAPDSPEDAANISGTTILPSEPDTSLDPEMMLESIGDLLRTSSDVLKLLVPASTDPVSIVNLASKLADPKNTQSRRLSRSKSKFESEASYFGGHSYIDVERNSELVCSALKNRRDGLAEDWTPYPMQKANCARFAIEVLLARAETDAPRQAIQHVEGLFPSVFMSDIVHDGQLPAMGESSLGKDTFNLALEIRTQFLIGLMEEHQNDPGFDPDALLQGTFLVEELPEEVYDSSKAPLRGFNLTSLGGADGYLPFHPSRFRDDAYDRFNELRLNVTDGLVDIDELKSTYRWSSFTMKAAQWIRKRNDEIDVQLRGRRPAEDIKDEYFASPRSVPRVSSIAPRSEATLSPARMGSARPSTLAAEYQRMTARGSPFKITPSRSRIPSNLRISDSHSIKNTPSPSRESPIHQTASDAPQERDDQGTLNTQGSPVERTAPEPSTSDHPDNQEEPRTAPEIRERRKSKPSFLNASSIGRIMQRQRRSSDFVQPSLQAEDDTLVSEDRRKTLPATSQSKAADPVEPERPAAPTAPVEPAEIPDTIIDSPLFVPQDDELLTINDTGFSLDADNSRIQIERSHSPPVGSKISHEPGRQRADSIASIPVNRSPGPGLPSDRELWQATKKHVASNPDAARSKHPRAAFIDHQENAHRVSPISHGANANDTQRTLPVPRPLNKRRREESNDQDEDEESEGEFDRDARTVDVSRKRAAKPAQRTNKRQRIANEDEEQAGSSSAPQNQETRGPSPTIPYRLSQPSTHQSHVRWTPAEDERLIRLIKEYECKWSRIEQENEAQPEKPGEKRIEARNQIQLKDRARNLRIKYHRNQQPLPKNFDRVTIKQADVDRLAKQGIIVPR